MKKTHFFPLFVPVISFLLIAACSGGSSAIGDAPLGESHATGDTNTNTTPQMGPVDRPPMGTDSDPSTGCDCTVQPVPAVCQEVCSQAAPAHIYEVGGSNSGNGIHQLATPQTTEQGGGLTYTGIAVPDTEKRFPMAVKLDHAQIIQMILPQSTDQDKDNNDSDNNP